MIEASAGLRVIGNFDPDKVAEQLGLTPSFINLKDDKDIWGKTRDYNVCGFHSPLEKSALLGEHLDWLAERFSDKHDMLREIQNENKIDIFCAVTSIGDEGLSLSPQNLSLINDLKIRLEVSLITLKDLDEEDLEDGNSDEL